MPNLQHKVLLKNMLHAMQGRCYCICIPLFKKGKKKKKRLLLTPKCARISWNTRGKKGCFHVEFCLTFLAPIQILYQFLGHLSFSKKHSSM